MLLSFGQVNCRKLNLLKAVLNLRYHQTYFFSDRKLCVEAKNETIKFGLKQCIATMIASQLFNQQQGNIIDEIYSVVTTGTDCKFLKLCENTIFIDNNHYFIKEIDKILGILTTALMACPQF